MPTTDNSAGASFLLKHRSEAFQILGIGINRSNEPIVDLREPEKQKKTM
jgi:hypothetical protein